MEVTLQSLLDTGQPILADGAMGTMLFSMGLERGAAPVMWNVERPDRIAEIHRGYIEAGSQIILTNTFVANRHNLSRNNLSERAAEFNQAAVKIARAEAAAADHGVVVAGDIGPTGGIVASYGDVPYETAVDIFRQQANALAEGGAGLFWIETVENLEEIQAAVEGARLAAPDIPIVATLSFGTNQNLRRTTYGATAEKAVELLSSLGVLALGANCGLSPQAVEAAVEAMHVHQPDVVLVAKANAGIPRLEGDLTVYPSSPEDMAAHALTARKAGAQIIGACCGSTPAHIKAMSAALGRGQAA
jgi:5-methyltetrahydrofolate--homocysteine methyltransferase